MASYSFRPGDSWTDVYNRYKDRLSPSDRNDLEKQFKSWQAKQAPAKPATPKPTTSGGGNTTGGGSTSGGSTTQVPTADRKVVPGKAGTNQINVMDYAGKVATDPSFGMQKDDPNTKNVNESTYLSERAEEQKINTAAGTINPDANKFKLDPNKTGTQVGTGAGNAINAPTAKPKDANNYEVKTISNAVNRPMNQLEAAQGQVSQGALMGDEEVPVHDMQGMATGVNADGTTNPTGQALQEFASINLSNVIDTSTAAGQQLAQEAGVNGYVDSKATVQGQLAALQAQFVGPNGEPKIPMWAQGQARNVAKIASFSGMTGTAATAAMAQAIMEASIPIAQQDAQFFQTLTIKNLDNEQQQTINTANILAKMEEQNVDNRMAAAIQNSKAFLEMDLANLSNEQQARVINNQNKIQALLEDQKAVNTKRMFVAQSQNEMDMFYSQLNSQIKMFNKSQNLDAQKFNATMEDSREKFYKEMQYNIAVANAKWRQEVQLTEDNQAFLAATTDVKNLVDLSTNQLNQIWDRSDALLDYIWKSSEGDAERKNRLAVAKLQGKLANKGETTSAIGSVVGTFLGSSTGQGVIKSLFDW